MKKLLLLYCLITSCLVYSDSPKKVLCELEGNYSITYEDFRRNYFNEAVEIAKNVAVTTTQSLFFLNRAKKTLNKDAWDKNKIEVTQYWAIDESSDDLLMLDYIIEPAPVWITQSDWKKEKKKTGLLVPAKDSHQLADAILMLLNNPELCKSFGEAGRIFAEENFSIEHVVSEHLGIYSNLVD